MIQTFVIPLLYHVKLVHYTSYVCFCSQCRPKQWLPPDEVEGTPVRRCRFDTHQRMISSCPKTYKNWRVSQLCESEPASFVYEPVGIEEMIHPGGDVWYPPNIEIQNNFFTVVTRAYGISKTYRNNYCASCNSAGVLTCRIVKSFEADHLSLTKYIQYEGSVRPFMFVFHTDLNRRSCAFGSDAFITEPNADTGIDTCQKITDALTSCPCDSVYDFSSLSCVRINENTNSKCLSSNQTIDSWLPSTYVKDVCHITSSIVNPNCTTLLNDYPDMHFYDKRLGKLMTSCGDNNIISCFQNSSECIVSRGLGLKPEPQLQLPPDYHIRTALPNLIPVTYEQDTYEFPLKEIKVESVPGLELVFGSPPLSSNQCETYSEINGSMSNILVCANRSIIYKLTGEIFSDYMLRGDSIIVCTKNKTAIFELEAYHYVTCGVSGFTVFIYIVFYCKGKKSVTGILFVCQLVTVLGLLLCYSFITTPKPWPVLCKLVASLLQYLFLSVHAWTNAMAVWMFRGLNSLNRVRHAKRMVTIKKYAMCAWGFPLVFVVMAFIMHIYPSPPFYPIYSDAFCFVADGWARMLLFTGPIYVQIVLDIVICIWASVIIVRSGAGLRSNREKRLTRMKIISVVKLVVIFGLQWLLLFFTQLDTPVAHQLWTALNILITLQGVLIILSQIITVKNLKKLLVMCNLRKPRRSSTSTQSRNRNSSYTPFKLTAL